MAAISLRSVVKRFAGTVAVSNVQLEIARGEFVALLGPSGCGKTTLLRLIAGFELLDEGAIHFGGRVIAADGIHVPPEARNAAIVFQSYALWPHMDVGENVGYALRVRGASRAERRAKVAEALEAVDLSGFEARRPADLSGGQRQRVALARCLAMDPSVVLLDEPLANLDVNLRAAMEDTFRAFHERTGATMIYVTHDQAEAMAMADRIAVMQAGEFLEVGTPEQLYAEPRSEFVARFVGNGQIVDCRLVGRPAPGSAAGLVAGLVEVELFGRRLTARALDEDIAAGTRRLCLRPENLVPTDAEGFAAIVRKATFKGAHALIEVSPAAMPGFVLPVQSPRMLAVGTTLTVAVRDAWLLPAQPVDKALVGARAA